MVHEPIKIFAVIDSISKKLGFILSFLVVYLMATVSFEVFMRYVFDRPTTWVWPLASQVFGAYCLFAGLFTMFRKKHIRIDLFFSIFPSWLREVARVLAFASIIIFLVVLIWQSSIMSWSSFLIREKGPSAFTVPVYPLKILIPLVAALFLWQSIADFFRHKF